MPAAASPSATSLGPCVAVLGEELVPTLCTRLEWDSSSGLITRIDRVRPLTGLAELDADAAAAASVVVPALYNAHTHTLDAFLADAATGLSLEAAVFRPAGLKYRALAAAAPATLERAAADALRFMARCGAVATCDFTELGAAGVRAMRAAERAAAPGVRAVVCSQLPAVPFDEPALCANAADLPPPVVADVRRLLSADDDDEIDSGAPDGVSESTIADLTDPAWRTLRRLTLEQAPRRRPLRAVHCLESDAYRTNSVRHSGRGDIERALDSDLYDAELLVHLSAASSHEIDLLARSGRPAVVCPRANGGLGLPLPPIAALLRARVPLLLGTDNVMLNAPNMLAEMDAAFRVARAHGGLDVAPRDILRMASINGARLLRRFVHSDQLDRDAPFGITEGAPADLVVFDFDQPHLRWSRDVVAAIVSRVTPADVQATLRAGQRIAGRPAA